MSSVKLGQQQARRRFLQIGPARLRVEIDLSWRLPRNRGLKAV